MASLQYIRHSLKVAFITTLICCVVIGAVALMKKSESTSSNLTGRLVSMQEKGIIPTLHISNEQVTQGFTAPENTHVFFTIPSQVRIPRITFFGGQDIDQTVRYWGYCFSGNEQSNIEAGLTGKAIYDGQFFYSLAERKAQTKRPEASDRDLLQLSINARTEAKREPASIAEIFYGDHLCYVMTETSLPSGLDSDDDDLNNLREITFGTSPGKADTDSDGIFDGKEIFTTKTDPRRVDTDNDGLSDLCEDKNQNGSLDPKETSPIAADTDRDDLCDGNGFAAGCPEPKRPYCYTNAEGKRECQSRPVGPAYGEDMNSNCAVDSGETDGRNPMTFGIADWYYKMNKFSNSAGTVTRYTPVSTYSNGTNSSAPFPIPINGGAGPDSSFPIPLDGNNDNPSMFPIPIDGNE